MNTIKLLFLLMMGIFGNAYAQTENEIIGAWESDKKDVIIEIYRSSDSYQGKYIWGKQIVESDGKTSKKDVKNPDKNLRTRNIVGITSLTSLRWNGKEYTDGKIYNAPSGDTYSCKVWIKNNKLYLRGYLGLSLLGQTASFHRHK
ncbi:DUF2147 domain-containing protein [uncultured Sphingobacterium sp.]|jgi:uncharacterized protein (DUF2147 family)|uniref:DUF2147 domain-containing protein n=1 Tax=uncultured Sphingobacterium sp. TaxID=182688 RepID=UPI003748875D